MSAIPPVLTPPPIDYPDSDGKPMADNTLQFRWIMTLKGNLDALFSHRPDVFVAGDLLWYPVEGEPSVRAAPDVMVAFGRPKGDRGSYKQWEEGDVPVTVAFEVLSPGNTDLEMTDKYLFYEEHGVEEYYVYDPDRKHLEVYLRKGSVFRRENKADGFVSPRLGVRFDLSGEEMAVYHPDGQRFLTFEEVMAERALAARERDEAHKQRDEANRRSVRMGDLLDKVLAQTATPEERAELARLRQEAAAPPSSTS